MVDKERAHHPVGWWLKEADARLEAAFDDVLAGHHVNRRDWQVLTTLAGSPAPRNTIANALTVFDGAEAVNSVIHRLCIHGWVEETNGILRLSAEGLRKQESIAPMVEQVRQKVAAALPNDQYHTLVRLLTRLVDAFPPAPDPQSP